MSLACIRQRQDSPSSASPSPTISPSYIPATYYNPRFNSIKGQHSPAIQPPLDLSYSVPSGDSYYIDSRQSTPSDRFSYGLADTQQYMQNSPSHYPEVRVQQPTPYGGLPSATPPPLVTDESDFSQSAWNYQDASYLIPSVHAQFAPTSYRSHKRLSSGSSIASGGPDSPYTHTSAYPQIVDPDTPTIHSVHLESFDGAGQFSESNCSAAAQNSEQAFYPAFQNFNLTGNNAVPMMAAQTGTRNNMNQQRGSSSGGQNTSSGSFGGEIDSSVDMRNTPQLDRTMSDIYQDELFNPAMAQSAQPRPAVITQGNLLSPHRAAFNDILQAANNGHLSARSASPITNAASRRSPFCESSVYAAPAGFQSNPSSPAARLNPAAHSSEQQKIDSDAPTYAQQYRTPRHDFMSPPKTISPKEAHLDFHESENDAKMPLFPSPNHETEIPQPANPYDRRLNRGNTENSNDQSFASMATSRRQSSSNYSASPAPGSQGSNFQFMSPSVPAMPPQYPFMSQQSRRQSSSMRSNSDQNPEFPASLNSMESTKSESGQPEHVRITTEPSVPSSQESVVQRPLDTSAGSGSYTCTAPECHARFDAAAKLQKHRREAHRSSPHASSTPTTPSSATTPYNQQAAVNNVSRNNQPGPHKCEKINPSTNKPCNTIFSRSYDLTRHEDTIHNGRKQKVRCHLCTEEKTFSRNDALTRHMRVVHPDVDFPGKTRRGRNNDGADVVRQRIEGGRAGR